MLRRNIQLMTKQDNVPYNDCFYRARTEFRYVTILDVDEVIMPRRHQNWTQMMQFLVSAFFYVFVLYDWANLASICWPK